jgi:hypothetical protein
MSVERWIADRMGPRRRALYRENRKMIGGMVAGAMIACSLTGVGIPVAVGVFFVWLCVVGPVDLPEPDLSPETKQRK